MKAKYLLEQALKTGHEMRMAQKDYFKTRDKRSLDASKKHEKEFDNLCYNIRQMFDTNQVED